MSSLLTIIAIGVTITFSQNPYKGKTQYVQQAYVAEVQSTIKMYPQNVDLLKKAQFVPVAYWIDTMARIANVSAVLDGAKKNGSNSLVTFVIYDVPDRDCSAAASNGEIPCADGQCTAGLQTYRSQYIDPIVKIFAQYPEVTIVAVVEPDSLPNLATNLGVPKCQQAQTAYKTGIAYAIKQLATLSHVHIYVDAAHGGWLGWQTNMDLFVPIIKGVLQDAGGVDLIRGFASNTANYQPLGSITSTEDYCKLESQYNFCTNEAKYIQFLDKSMAAAGMTGYGYITDTSRNGVAGARTDQSNPCSQWCNIDNTGLHYFPSTDTSSTGLSIIDAFVWIKVPGESDGTSNQNVKNYDYHCGSDESVKPAPQAGQWFSSFFLMLCQNADPPLQ